MTSRRRCCARDRPSGSRCFAGLPNDDARPRLEEVRARHGHPGRRRFDIPRASPARFFGDFLGPPIGDSPAIDYRVPLIVPVGASPYPLVRETLMLAPGAAADCTPEELRRSRASECQLKEVMTLRRGSPTECAWNKSLTIQRRKQR